MYRFSNSVSRLVVHDAIEPPISDCFPNEQLFRVQEEPWYADIVNYLVIGDMPQGWNKNDRDHFLFMVQFSCGMTRICSNIVWTKLLDNVFPMGIFKVSFLFPMINLVDDTLVKKRPLRGFFKEDFIGRPYLETPMNIVNDACISTNGQDR